MLNQDQMKKLAGETAIKSVSESMVVGVGTGSTVRYFIEQLANMRFDIKGAVASSKKTEELLKQYKIPVFDLNSVGKVDVYIDGADEINHYLEMIKGGGAALTREKIVASCSLKFICIADESKYVVKLGQFPLPVEVIPMARSYVAREILKLGGTPDWRQDVVTDNGNWILDIYNLDIQKPMELEEKINNIEGVVANGICAKRSADILLLAKADGNVELIKG
ncbi:MAG: ribose-5-phosphate isomerase RpiA [Neisseriaceae bacterium]